MDAIRKTLSDTFRGGRRLDGLRPPIYPVDVPGQRGEGVMNDKITLFISREGADRAGHRFKQTRYYSNDGKIDYKVIPAYMRGHDGRLDYGYKVRVTPKTGGSFFL